MSKAKDTKIILDDIVRMFPKLKLDSYSIIKESIGDYGVRNPEHCQVYMYEKEKMTNDEWDQCADFFGLTFDSNREHNLTNEYINIRIKKYGNNTMWKKIKDAINGSYDI